ncbi:MAG: phosphoribosylformylglycinamidine cyclo-ligase [Deferribacteraceae bacterium]|jgi:phosphoribosylformylglycinamidine cyclo-ligase|nr:phosphoribosylformylglycinamidine cyclo-ligase [Deferribacteraceae bacterium]
MNKKIKYNDAGVNIDEGNLFVNKIKGIVASTFDENVPEGIGGFAGFYAIPFAKNMEYPMLVSSTDGVGTKLKVAIESGILDTVGIDLVAMCVNDLIVTGARPLFFLDYIATGKLSADKSVKVLEGIVEGCKQANASLLGGETAEMPDMYQDGDFDLAGFAVGVVDKPKIINGKGIKEGDWLLGLSSSGFHSNGYSLLRKIFFKELKMKGDEEVAPGVTLNELLLTPTKIYVKEILNLIETCAKIKGMVHITGGGFYENIPRVMPNGLSAKIYPGNMPNLLHYDYLKSLNLVEEKELFRVFNMGIGFVLIVDPFEGEKLLSGNNNIFKIGEVYKGNEVVVKGVDF